MTTNGRHRFAATTDLHFNELFQLLHREPALTAKLKDQGVGGAPRELLAAVENGLRSHGDDLHAMGTNAMRSAGDWKRVFYWMKREAYIAAARHKWGKGSYCQWDHFDLQDYLDRCKLTVTFLKRHLIHSNGRPFHGVVNPTRWSKRTGPPPTKRGKRSSASASASTAATPPTSQDVMMFDHESGKLVPIDLVDSSDDDWESDA